MSCECGYADECDGEHGVLHPLQDGGLCSVVSCKAPRPRETCPHEHAVEDWRLNVSPREGGGNG
jgi:hypothetical protein